ncbi:MAG: glycosyltransferase family 39 protein [Saprospiraceae bacterium]|uniref:Glycosyltransferase family 39 protein n=1 Tax=Candidatus Opimibacter skivensis TaxID=2982028 RepID=A0A9D7XPX8_9BACT|nr:glycosyltransferase family 39 protein [Candidatus Opimibacter skivensis]
MKLLLRNEVIIIIIIGVIFFFPFLGSVHLFDWDEINFAECSREMMVLHDYSRVYIDFKPFWEKPPMFFWMQSSAMMIFSVTEFAARFPNAICGIVTLLVLFLFGTRLFDRKFGLFWALAYGGSIFPNLYFKSGIIDPWFNLFIFISIYYLICYHWKRNEMDKEGLNRKKFTYICFSAIFMGFAILTKGPVALIIFGAVGMVYLVYNRFKIYFNWLHVLAFIVIAALVILPWYGYETAKNGSWFITEFLRYQIRLFTTHDAGQKGFFGYHFVVILLGCFPASVFALPAFFKMPYNTRYEKDIKLWMLILFWVVMILFTIVQSRIIHYSSLAWFPVSFLAAYTFYKWDRKEKTMQQYIPYVIAITGGLISIALMTLPFFAMHIRKFIPYVQDKFAQAAMGADVYWSGWECLPGVFMLLVIYYGLRKLNRKKFITSAWVFFTGTAIVIFMASSILIPKIERYSQGAAIDFFIQRQGEDCYVRTLGFKSYGELFYTQKAKPLNVQSYDTNWLLTGNIDKSVYFVTKINRVDDYKKYEDLKELYRKNGFVFLKRVPK